MLIFVCVQFCLYAIHSEDNWKACILIFLLPFLTHIHTHLNVSMFYQFIKLKQKVLSIRRSIEMLNAFVINLYVVCCVLCVEHSSFGTSMKWKCMFPFTFWKVMIRADWCVLFDAACFIFIRSFVGGFIVNFSWICLNWIYAITPQHTHTHT